jgi:hypothetical protein
MAFEQATIKVEKQREFGELKSALEQVFAADRITQYLKKLDSRNIRVRDFEAVLAKGVTDALLGGKSGTARALYEALPVSDQAQMREFYLSKLEEVEPALRARFNKLYRYY